MKRFFFTDTEVIYFIKNAFDSFELRQSEIASLYEGLQVFFRDDYLKMEVDLDTINHNARIIVSYDSLEEHRRRNRKLFKDGCLLALTLAATWYAKPAVDAAIITASFLAQKLLSEGDKSREKLTDAAFSKVMDKHRIDKSKQKSF